MSRTPRAAALLAAALALPAAVGCANGPGVQARTGNFYDPCWPERYSQQAREAVLNPFDTQVNNARIIDQTVWNYHFEPGTAVLNGNGRQKLDYVARRLPVPDADVYFQTARDLAYDPAAPEKLVVARTALDAKRADAILAYLAAQPNGATAKYSVQGIDAFDPGVNSAGPAQSVRGLPLQYRSTLSGAVGQPLNGAGGNLGFGAPAAQTTNPTNPPAR